VPEHGEISKIIDNFMKFITSEDMALLHSTCTHLLLISKIWFPVAAARQVFMKVR
jgi:hypothetical protein